MASSGAPSHPNPEVVEFDECRDLRDINVNIGRYPQLAWLKATANPRLDWGSGFNAAVVVLRYILTQLPPDARRVKDADAEKQNPILAYAFTHFPERVVDIARLPYLRAITENPAANPEGRSFHDIMEGELMRSTFWTRDLYHLFLRQLPMAHTGEDDFIIRERDDPLANEAARSLVVWDGSIPLGDHLSQLSGRRRLRDMPVDYIRLMRFPLIIRVLVTPAEGVEIEFKDIRSADVRGHIPATIGEGHHSTRIGGPIRYGLLAVVRLRADANDVDLVRLYDPLGYSVRCPFLWVHANDNWRFGVPGHSYMIYMAPDSTGQLLAAGVPASPLVPETLRLSAAYEANKEIFEQFVVRRNPDHLAEFAEDVPVDTSPSPKRRKRLRRSPSEDTARHRRRDDDSGSESDGSQSQQGSHRHRDDSRSDSDLGRSPDRRDSRRRRNDDSRSDSDRLPDRRGSPRRRNDSRDGRDRSQDRRDSRRRDDDSRRVSNRTLRQRDSRPSGKPRSQGSRRHKRKEHDCYRPLEK